MNLCYNDARYKDKINYTDNLTCTEILSQWQWSRNYAGTLSFKSSSNICFGYLLELPHGGNSNKYPKHMFCEEIRIKHGICCTLFCSLRILYNSKFISLETKFEGWSQDCSKSDGCFSKYLISSPWRNYEDYNISFCKQWKFRCHCLYEQWHLNLHCLQRGQSCP